MSKYIIKKCLSPALSSGRDISISGAKAGLKVLLLQSKNDYEKLDAMIYYVETGNDYTCNYGDIDAPFYNTLISVFEKSREIFYGK